MCNQHFLVELRVAISVAGRDEAMPEGLSRFRINLREVVNRASRLFGSKVGDVTLNLPFVSVGVKPEDAERVVAREIVIRLKDRRVLSASECCDGCIESALQSIGEIRGIIVDKQVELSGRSDGPLYLVLEAMVQGIRDFQTYEELINRPEVAVPHPRFGVIERPHDLKEAYFSALEVLRGHISRCLDQVCAIGMIDPPHEGLLDNYRDPWPLDAYVSLSRD